MTGHPPFSGITGANAISVAPGATGWIRVGTNVQLNTITDTVTIGTTTAATGAKLTVVGNLDLTGASAYEVRALAADVNPTVSLSTTGLALGAGGATATDVLMSRGAANRLDLASGDSLNLVSGSLLIAAVPIFEADADLAISLVPNADNTLSVGTSARRVSFFDGVTHRVFSAASDAQPSISIGTSGIAFGAGGAAATDVLLARSGAAALTLTGALTTQARSINTSFNLAAAGVYIVAATDDFVGMDTTTGAQAVNLPVAVTGRRLVIKNTALVAVVNACNVTPNGAETIDGIAALVALTGTQSITLLGRAGTGWYIV